jgi:uncharacterized metal-binding protein YceD (DUF177 family)
MSSRREFEIAFVGLKAGIHEFSYEITDKFFAEYQTQDFRHCQANVKMFLDKKNSFMLLRFEIGGKIEIACDRCGNMLPLDLWDEFNILVKLVEEPDLMNQQEEDPDVYYISKGESHLRVSDWIYEFINLSIPMQRMCKEEEMGGPYCNMEVLDMLKKLELEKSRPGGAMWKGLEKFKDLPPGPLKDPQTP